MPEPHAPEGVACLKPVPPIIPPRRVVPIPERQLAVPAALGSGGLGLCRLCRLTKETEMKRLLLSTALIFAATMSMAAVTADELVTAFQAKGYTKIEVVTGLTQIKVEATKGDAKVEVIYDAQTGDILKQETSRANGNDLGTGVEVTQEGRDFVDANDGGDDNGEDLNDDANDDNGEDMNDDGNDDNGDDVNDDSNDDDNGDDANDDSNDDDNDQGDDSGDHGENDDSDGDSDEDNSGSGNSGNDD
jgi:hypothetical protein